MEAAFARVFGKLGRQSVRLDRGLSSEGELRPPDNGTFVSATFDPAVAKAHFHSAGDESRGLLYRQTVPIERVFMTYLETRQMNESYREAEAVLLYRESALGF